MANRTIAGVAAPLIATIKAGGEIFKLALAAMDLIENSGMSGKDKKATVLAFMLGEIVDFEKWRDAIDSFIDAAKSLFNSVIALAK